MNLSRVNYFIANYFEREVITGRISQEDADKKCTRIENDIYDIINSNLWRDEWMEE